MISSRVHTEKNNASDLYDGNGETVVYLEDAFFHGKRAANQSMIMGAQMREAARAARACASDHLHATSEMFAILLPPLLALILDVTYFMSFTAMSLTMQMSYVHASFGPLHSKHVSHIPVW